MSCAYVSLTNVRIRFHCVAYAHIQHTIYTNIYDRNTQTQHPHMYTRTRDTYALAHNLYIHSAARLRLSGISLGKRRRQQQGAHRVYIRSISTTTIYYTVLCMSVCVYTHTKHICTGYTQALACLLSCAIPNCRAFAGRHAHEMCAVGRRHARARRQPSQISRRRDGSTVCNLVSVEIERAHKQRRQRRITHRADACVRARFALK